jgi:hypothetical protein
VAPLNLMGKGLPNVFYSLAPSNTRISRLPLLDTDYNIKLNSPHGLILWWFHPGANHLNEFGLGLSLTDSPCLGSFRWVSTALRSYLNRCTGHDSTPYPLAPSPSPLLHAISWFPFLIFQKIFRESEFGNRLHRRASPRIHKEIIADLLAHPNCASLCFSGNPTIFF